MTNVSPNAIDGTWARSAVAVLFWVGLVFSVAAARAENSGSGGASPVEEFSQQLEAFQKSVPDLNKSIQDSAGTIDSMNDVEKARAEIDKLRETVSALLGAVSDNGPVSQLGAKALNHVHDKLKALAQDSAAALDRRKLGGVEIERHLRDRRDRDRLDLDVADVAGRPAGGDGRADDQGADRKTKTPAHGRAPAFRSHAPGGLMPPISLLS